MLFFFRNYKFIFFLFIFLLFQGFKNILFLNEEYIISYALVSYFSLLIIIFRFLVLNLFFFDTESIFNLFFLAFFFTSLFLLQLFININLPKILKFFKFRKKIFNFIF